MALKRWAIAEFDFTTINGWSASASGTAEYYYTGTAIEEPTYVKLDGTLATEGTVGSLAAGTWGWGDNDTLGASTLYVRLSDDSSPGATDVAYFITDEQTLMTATAAMETILLSLFISNYSTTYAARITCEHTDGTDNLFEWVIDLSAAGSPFALDSKIVLEPGDVLKFTSTSPWVSILASGDES